MQRQYCGTLGRTDNCQIGLFLAYATGKGRALIDRELYLPVSWTSDRDRCRRAQIPDEVAFATKPQQARMMIERAIMAGVPFARFTADEAYGQNPGLRSWLEEQDIAYVMATRCDDEVASGLHTTSRVDRLIARVPAGAWRRLSCGDGAHGPRIYDWASLPIRRPFPHGRRGWILARRPHHSGHARRRVPRRHPDPRDRKRGPDGGAPALIPLSSNEVRRLFGKLVLAGQAGPAAADHVLHWSDWRRWRQAQAKASHYRKRLNPPKGNEPP